MRSDFGKRLFDARKHAGLTQEELCKRAGMSQANYQKLEKVGKGTSYTVSIAKVTGVSAEWLASGTGDMLPATYTLSAEAARYELKLTPAAEALARMFDKVPTADPLAWSTLYHSIVQAIAEKIPAQTLELQPGQGKQPEESRALQKTRNT